MTAIRNDSFGGIAPIFDARKLPLDGAVIARNGKFDGSDFRPLLGSTLSASLSFAVARLHKYRYKGQSTWLGWPVPQDVDVVPSPIPQDELGRLYWSRVIPSTIHDDGADNYPRVASQPTQTAILANSPGIVRRLGVPQPTAPPTLVEQQQAHAVSSGANPPTITAMSQTSPVTVTAPGHDFEDGWTVLVEADGTSDGGMAEMVGLTFTVAHVAADTFDLMGSDGANYTAFVAGATKLKISRAYDTSDIESRSYVYTFVTDWGEEGAPSPPSDAMGIQYDSTVTVTCDTGVPAWAASSVNRVRIYRTASGTANTEFFFVAEAAIGPGGSTDVLDDVLPVGLGELLPGESWVPPPNGLRGLVAMPNGFLAGFKGNTLYFSEPHMPHAWPDAYRKTVQDDIVGIAVYGQTLVVATLGKPYVASGVDPYSMTLARLDIDAPCLSKGGVCSVGTGVIYPCPDGLAYVSGAEAMVMTKGYMTQRQWNGLWSNTMDAIFHDGRYIAFSRESGKRSLIVERRPEGGIAISDTDTMGRAPARDPDDDKLHFVGGAGSAYNQRWVFDNGLLAPTTGQWKGRVWAMPQAVNLSMGQVFASGYPLTLTVRYANLQPNGQPLGEISDSYDITVTGPEPFRLPGGFLSREYQLDISTEHAIQTVLLTDNADELRQQ